MNSGRHSNRRQFLQGEAARRAVENFADGFRSELPRSVEKSTSPGQKANYLFEYSRDAMAVAFHVFLPAALGDFSAAAIEALDLLEPLEQQMTVYRDSSDISLLNKYAVHTWQAVEPRLFALLALGQEIARATGGAYDFTSGALSKLWGFHRRQGRMPSAAEITDCLTRVGHDKLQLDVATSSLRIDQAGLEINLGSIGKGYALDRLAQSLRDAQVNDFLLHGGHSSVLASGSRAANGETEPGWSVGLSHPLKPGQRLLEFRLRNRALGTSGAGNQFFHHQGKRYGHILDPRSGWPAEKVLSVTVLAPTAAEADALSTAFYVGGEELAREYISRRPDISALLVSTVGRAGESELIAINFDENEWRYAE